MARHSFFPCVLGPAGTPLLNGPTCKRDLNMRRLLFLFSVLLVPAAGLLWWAKRDRAVQVDARNLASVLGPGSHIELMVSVPGPGIRHLALRLKRPDRTYLLHEAHFAPIGWRGSGIESYELKVAPDWKQVELDDGTAELELWLSTYAWRWQPLDRTPVWSHTVQLDFTPPRLELLTTQHNVRLGGVELAIWRQDADTVRSGIEVGPYFFPATTGFFADDHLALALFAVPQDLDSRARVTLIGADAVGNESRIDVPARILPQRFAQRTLVIDDEFLTRKVPEIEQDVGLPSHGDLVQRYLRINRDLRQQNEAHIRSLTAHSAPELFWQGAFHRQSNSAPLSSFADRRTYVYRGNEIDRQVHQGFDLASLQQSPVEAANNGRVVFTGNLGIYGNTVIVDHGLGLFTLYGHLSSIAVELGSLVRKGQHMGRTGQTGLAGGDHLHFSTLLYGVHVDPIEWWDGDWIRKHILAKVNLYPRKLDQQGSEG